MKTSDLTGAALDWAVAKCEGFPTRDYCPHDKYYRDSDNTWFCPSEDWEQGGPIIEREGIGIQFVPAGTSHGWWAIKGEPFHDRSRPDETRGESPLIAAMRCYVASKLGDTIDIPEELK